MTGFEAFYFKNRNRERSVMVFVVSLGAYDVFK